MRWGVATSAYQIEGGRGEKGKGDSIWDTFSDAGRLHDRGDTACDHFHRLEEDLDLIAQLGVDTYRFSVAWTRVLPAGRGEVNTAGLDFYRRLCEGLAERGVEPCLTLYHWDLPQALQEGGGWASRQTIDDFENYATVMAEGLGDLVGIWITHNEPWVASFLGHLEGVFAPGLQDWPTTLQVAHNLLVSHGAATRAIRNVLPQAKVGIALDCRPSVPANGASIAADKHFDGFRNRWFFDPVFGRGYPLDMVETYQERGRLTGGLAELVRDGDMEIISSPIDFLGINYYTTVQIADGAEEKDDPEGPIGVDPPDGFTEMGWKVDESGLTDFLMRIDREYKPRSIYVTENGASYSTGPNEAGRIPDDLRIDYLDRHIEATVAAREDGVPVDGYFVWSLMDNLEWVAGFSQRFGLVWVDQNTGERIPKDSFFWYRDFIAGR